MDKKPWKYPLAVSPSDPSSIMAFPKSFANHCDSFASFDPDDYLDIHVPKTFATTVSTSAPAPDATSLLDVSRYSGNPSHSNTLDGSSSAPANPTSALTTSITSNLHPPTTLDIPEGEGEALPRGQPRRRRQGSSERDYSEEIRNLNKKRKRTGQACDRCPVRRFACDPSPEGCGKCTEQGLECKITDSVTGETYVRGAAGAMKAEIEVLKARITALESENAQLRTLYGLMPGVEHQ